MIIDYQADEKVNKQMNTLINDAMTALPKQKPLDIDEIEEIDDYEDIMACFSNEYGYDGELPF